MGYYGVCQNGWDECSFFNDTSDNTCYQYYYPEEANIKYLYESYPTVISPIKGVEDEHFMVWMRTAALPTFRKLYGRIEGPFKKGDSLEFSVQSAFIVESFGGTKALVVSNLSDLGGKNPYLGVSYIVVGSLSLLFGSLFALKNMISPRPIGSPTLLPWS